MSPATITAPGHTLLSPVELSLAPMPPCHKSLVQRHYTRLLSIIAQPNDLLVGNYTTKQAAREQLARMTLIIRDYISHARTCKLRGKLEEYDEEIESMIIDVTEAALTLNPRVCTPWTQPVFVNGRLWGREQEVAGIMQEQSAEGVDDVVELWNTVSFEARGGGARGEKPLPDRNAREDIGRGIDWNRVLLRSRSEGNIMHLSREFEIEDLEKWNSDLVRRELEELDLLWPPKFKDPEPNVGRQRGRTMTGPNSHLASVDASRAGSRATSPVAGRVRKKSRKWTAAEEGLSAGLLKNLQEKKTHAGNDSAVGSPVLCAKSNSDAVDTAVLVSV